MTGEELKALFARAGLEVTGPWEEVGVLPPRAAWRRIVSGETAPTVTVRADRPAEIDAQWHRLATGAGLFGGDGVFLIDVEGAGPGCPPRRWTRVRLDPGWRLADVLGELPGSQPEFVTTAVDGDTVVGVTAGEDGIRVTVVDRIAERVEAEARAAAEETEQERAAAWEALFEVPENGDKLRARWVNGLGGNPGVPDDLRVDLVGLSDYLMYSPQPTAVVEAAMVHPDWSIRGEMAEHQPNLTPEQRARMILAEDDAKRLRSLAWLVRYRRAELTAPGYRRLATAPSAQVREQAADLPGLPASLLTALTADSHASVRATACKRAWPQLDQHERERLLNDPDGTVRSAALLRHHEDHPMPRAVFEARGFEVRAVERCRLERDLAEALVHDPEPERRCSLARNPHMDTDLVLLLGRDPDDRVRWEASLHPGLTEEERATIDFPFDPGIQYHALDWIVALHDDLDALRRLAVSAHPLVRRSVAHARRLPADIVERLARDEDRVVHLFLAENCDDAPADLLLSVWQWWTGSLSTPDRPHGHPNFPRRDLLRHADDPSPRMRRLALDDPDSTAELVERFSRDPSVEVRRRAAEDPRLSVASAVRLLEDPYDRVRYAASQHPGLPARVLTRLLRDRETAQEAARHPGLPVPVMRRMLDEARGRGAV
ncbi:PE-PGRS family protein [Streptomyces sp. NBC_01275]|uniref:PE-PGRS family protein n=1 Tax=Streptomyces sp. NBC_01275 TaxID=2903807 RepID=UPI00224DC3B9|nr:PE-PGRS family protein [Streptomyces sp. NBC_01275]MCX4767339.1 PE-PGRS family protein [Streptomyces sp. NBC_01275]